ncbi:hypothetical protein [Bradyrhizobium sp. HKCCYLRH1030]|uniref:hypothetical protein n=1 Tax=Bradyrhizobium sp. HKCCYLRH1030 TaxID=3420744 RepID=UPI003EBFD9E3
MIAVFEADQFPESVWHAAAIARSLNAAQFKQCLAQTKSSGPGDDRAFGAFGAHADVIRIDEEHVRLRDAARARIIRRLADDKPGAQTAGQQIYETVASGDSALDQFAVLLVIQPSAAASRFEALYADADDKFDLSGCDTILEIMREREPLLDPLLRRKLIEKEQYLSARLLFVDDYYRTVSYFDHGDLLTNFQELVNPSLLSRFRNQRWLLDLHGKGGVGKTMFRRWIVSRHCLPASSKLRTPVARVDIDFIYRALLISQPWLVLLSIAMQLRPQLPNAPFSEMMGPEQIALRDILLDRTTNLRTQAQQALVRAGESLQQVLEDQFCLGLGETKAVLIFDTLEELSVHQPSVLANLLSMLERLHRRCPGLKVVLSGRYRIFDPAKRMEGIESAVWDEMLHACIDLPVERLKDRESLRFLIEVRLLNPEQPLAEIVKKSRGNPFVLSLFADLASGRTLTAEEVRTSKIAFAYLIERIIDRIPDEDVLPDDGPDIQRRKYTQRGLRWLLRYAVVPRRLTRSFAAEVLAEFVLDELHDKTHRDETSLEQAGARYTDHDRWRRSNIPIAFSDLWAALQSYASSSSWVNGSGDELELQPEIMVPMRQLLSEKAERYPIWTDLQGAAAEYFERMAEKDGSVGKHLQEALFHRHQAEGAMASRWFDQYLKQCHAADADYSAVQALCGSLFGEDYMDRDQKPLQHFTGGAIIATETLGAAALELFLASVIRQLQRPSKMSPAIHTAMQSRFATFARYGGTGARAELARLAALVYGFGSNSATDGSDPSLTELNNQDERIAAALLAAKRPETTIEVRRQWYERAVVLAETQTRPTDAFQTYFVRAQLAMFDATTGNHESAFKVLRESLTSAMRSGAPVVQVSDLLLLTGDLGFALGHWLELERLASRAVELPFPAHEEATWWLVQIALNRFEYARAEELIAHLNTTIEPVRQECKAELHGATFRFAEAERNYAAARIGYQNLQHAGGGSLVLINHTRFLLDTVGATQRAAQVLDPLAGSRSFAEPIIELQMNMLRLRINARNGEHGRARGHLNRILKLLEREPQLAPTYAMVAIATLLAEGAGTAPDAAWLGGLMAEAPGSSQLMALRPFLSAVPGVHLAAEFALPLPHSVSSPHDRLCLAAAYIFFGQPAIATNMLRSILDEGPQPVVAAIALRLARRITPKAVEPPSDWVRIWAQQGKKEPGLAGIVLLEEADNLIAIDRVSRAKQALTIAKAYLGDLPVDSKWSKLLVRLEATIARRGLGSGPDIENELATLPAEKLLQPVSMLSIGVGNTGCIELRYRDVDTDEEIVRSADEELLGALAMASTSNDLYPLEWAQLLSEAPAPDEGFVGRIWRSLTGVIPESEGTARLRDRLSTLLADIITRKATFGYAWNRGSLAPVRRVISKPISDAVPKLPAAQTNDAPLSHMIAVETALPAMASVPWELGHSGSEPFFRTQRTTALPDTILHLRRAANELRQSADDPVMADTWDSFVSELGGLRRVRGAIRERLDLSPVRRVLVLSADADTQRRQRSGYGTSGLRLEDVYRKAGFEVTVLPLDPKTVLSRLDAGNPPSVVHVSARIMESFSPREVFLESEPDNQMHAELLSQILLHRDERFLRPLLVLDASENRNDPGRTLLLRNAFASRIHGQATRGVLAIGPSPTELLRPAAELLAELLGRSSIGLADLHNAFWAGMTHPIAPALFTLDPDLPVGD